MLAACMNQQQQPPTNLELSDTEMDELDGYVDADQKHFSSMTHNQQQDSSQANSFLMDKNKKLFPQKLWELIHNPSIQHCLRWSEDGQRVYLNRNEFEAYYLKTANNQFHTQKAISFVRQMNMYGFRKVDDCFYENDNFRRDQQHLLRNMIRRHPNKGLFVTLDHHQLAAAAAAQAQALQVNQHLQQLEQQHKQRAEQALRLTSYLTGTHFHPHPHTHLSHGHSAPAHHAHQQHAAAALMQQHSQQLGLGAAKHPQFEQSHHSAPFERMSSQLAAQMVANQLKLQQHQQQQDQQEQHSLRANLAPGALRAHEAAGGSSATSLQPKKSRLLNDFYASINSNGCSQSKQHHQHQHQHHNHNQQQQASNQHKQHHNHQSTSEATNKMCNMIDKMNSNQHENNNQLVSMTQHSHDSMQSTSSLESQSQSSGSAGSPQLAGGGANVVSSSGGPGSEAVTQQRLAAMLSAAAAAAAAVSRSASISSNVQEAKQANNTNSTTTTTTTNNNNNNNHHSPASNTNNNNASSNRSSLNEVVNNLVINKQQDSSLEHNTRQQQQALHETLVRSLIQFKQQQQHSQSEFLASLQQQQQHQLHNHHHNHHLNQHHQQQQHQMMQQKSLLESLASLSSAGTGSIVDQSSESVVTERSSSPVSAHSSSRDLDHEMIMNNNHGATALNLAKSHSPIDLIGGLNQPTGPTTTKTTMISDSAERLVSSGAGSQEQAKQNSDTLHRDEDEDYGIDVEEADENEPPKDHNHEMLDARSRCERDGPELVGSPLDGAKKVKKFLEDYHDHGQLASSPRDREANNNNGNKRARIDRMLEVHVHDDEGDEDEDEEEQEEQECDESIEGPISDSKMKPRSTASRKSTAVGIDWLSRNLIIELCDRRGDKLDMEALGQAARYTECFLETLIDDAASIARHHSPPSLSLSDDLNHNSQPDHTNRMNRMSPASKDSTMSDLHNNNNINHNNNHNQTIDSCSLSLALKLIPSKLMASINSNQQQQQQQVKLEHPMHPAAIVESRLLAEDA